MGTTIELESSDGHRFAGYRADPPGAPRGGVLVIQEIFGVNPHIRRVCDGFAGDGYLALAPALFDRVERGVELGYDGEGMQGGIKIVTQLKPGNTLRDLQAGVGALARALEQAGKPGKIGVVGYCYGGTMAWVSAAKLEGIACAVGYYGGQIDKQAALAPRVPVMLHFGDKDQAIPPQAIETVRNAHPDVPIHTYDAGHGFNCDARDSYDEPSAALARQRTLAFFAEHLE